MGFKKLLSRLAGIGSTEERANDWFKECFQKKNGEDEELYEWLLRNRPSGDVLEEILKRNVWIEGLICDTTGAVKYKSLEELLKLGFPWAQKDGSHLAVAVMKCQFGKNDDEKTAAKKTLRLLGEYREKCGGPNLLKFTKLGAAESLEVEESKWFDNGWHEEERLFKSGRDLFHVKKEASILEDACSKRSEQKSVKRL